MRIVTLKRDMRPWRAGQDAVVPDAIADMLIKSNEASNPRPFPPPDVAPRVAVGERPVLTLKRPRAYYTRGKGEAT
jgi:hypothetical protein